jgi:hypothetical protein
MAKWVMDNATLTYDYKISPVSNVTEDGNEKKVRVFFKRRYEFTAFKEGYIDTPTTADIQSNTNIVFTNGESSERSYPTLSPSVSGDEYVNYLTYAEGGDWNIKKVTRAFNTRTSVWTTYVTMEGSWDKYKRVRCSGAYKEYI